MAFQPFLTAAAITSYAAITPGSSPVPGNVLFIRVGGAGNLVLRGQADGADVTLPVTAGEYVPAGAGVIVQAASTATGLVALIGA